LQPLSDDDNPEDGDPEEDNSEPFDVLLNETAHILYDLIVPGDMQTMTQKTVGQGNLSGNNNSM